MMASTVSMWKVSTTSSQQTVICLRYRFLVILDSVSDGVNAQSVRLGSRCLSSLPSASRGNSLEVVCGRQRRRHQAGSLFFFTLRGVLGLFILRDITGHYIRRAV